MNAVGGSWSTLREPTHAQEEHANSTQRGLQLGFKVESFLL